VPAKCRRGAGGGAPQAGPLPLKLAVALLKDRNGVINIDLPMTGSLDDPQFRLGPLIWKAFVGLLGKIAPSPFTLLAKLGGREDEINQLDFAAGSAVLDAAGAGGTAGPPPEAPRSTPRPA